MNIIEKLKETAAAFLAKKNLRQFNSNSWSGRLPRQVYIGAELGACLRPDGSKVWGWLSKGDAARYAVSRFAGRDRRAEDARLDMIARPKYYRLSKAAVKRLRAGAI
jgi:hypothetical protein